jgi:ubiquinone/menaquinone biosynthesis C-methylase UbiE
MKKNTSMANARSAKESLDKRLKFAHFPFLRETILGERKLDSPPLRVLDVGCGPGNLGFFFVGQIGCRLFGIDLWPNQLRQASAQSSYEGLFQVNLIHGLPFSSESFDVIVCNEVLMYLPNALEALTEFDRVLAPGGKLFVYNPISRFPRLSSAVKRFMRKIYQERKSIALDVQSNWKQAERACRITYYSFHTLIEQIRSANFSISATTGFRIFRNRIRLMKLLENYAGYRRLIQSIAARYPHLASDILVVSHKKTVADEQRGLLDQAAA